jgi:hypothetical protein
MSGNVYLVLGFNYPFDGIEIERDWRGLRVKVPFSDLESASFAAQKMWTRIEQVNPVVPGSLVPMEIEDGNDNDQ